MKRLLSAIVFPAMFISISNVYALDIQPGGDAANLLI